MLATWLALGLMLWQTLLSAGAIEKPMAPMQMVGDNVVICTEHGPQTLRDDGSLPAHPASDHSAPSCPCCLPFAAGNGIILAEAPLLAAPAVFAAPLAGVQSAAPRPYRLASDPQQPRAPPVPI